MYRPPKLSRGYWGGNLVLRPLRKFVGWGGGGGAFWTIPKTQVIKPWGEVTGVGEGAGRVPKNLFIRRLQPYVYMGPFLRTGPSF